MAPLAVTSVSSPRCEAFTCFRIGSKLRCMRSTPTEMQSMSENDFECFASTGVNMPKTMFPNSGPANIRFPRSRLVASIAVRSVPGPVSALPLAHLQLHWPRNGSYFGIVVFVNLRLEGSSPNGILGAQAILQCDHFSGSKRIKVEKRLRRRKAQLR